VKLCMFTPKDRDLERGWPGRLDGDRVVQLAAQTLQSFFTGGGSAREHDVFSLDDVVLRAPVLHPGSVRIFDGDDFAFANPSSIYGPDEHVPLPVGAEEIEARLRIAVVIGASVVGGFTLMNDWRAPSLPGAKAHDFATTIGPVVVTPDEFDGAGADWDALLDHAELNTRFFPGDIVAGPVLRVEGPFRAGDAVELSLDGVGTLRSYVAAAE
jgi:2-keto-4-pentenoate hydratase/2-oxohepta-3-ene-1,7-dioic acid hydratase in catechol pathway